MEDIPNNTNERMSSFDFEIQAFSTNDETSKIIPVSRFCLSQRSEFFRSALLDVGDSKCLVVNADTDAKVLVQFFRALNTGVLTCSIFELVDMYGLALRWKCSVLARRLKENFQDAVLDGRYSFKLISNALKSNFPELLSADCLAVSFCHWAYYPAITKSFSADMLEEILECIKRKGITFSKKSRWNFYRIVSRIIDENYPVSKVEFTPEEAEMYEIQSMAFFTDSLTENDREILQRVEEKTSKKGMVQQLWRFVPWYAFPVKEIAYLLEHNPRIPREVASNLDRNEHEEVSMEANYKNFNVPTEILLNVELLFPRWYEENYADCLLKVAERELPVHYCVMKELFPELTAPSESIQLISPPSFYHQLTDQTYELLMKILYGHPIQISKEAEQDDLFNILLLVNLNGLEHHTFQISQFLKKDEDYLWKLFKEYFRNPAFFDYFSGFAINLGIESILLNFSEESPIVVLKYQLAWVNLIASANLSPDDKNMVTKLFMKSWFGEALVAKHEKSGHHSAMRSLLLHMLGGAKSRVVSGGSSGAVTGGNNM